MNFGLTLGVLLLAVGAHVSHAIPSRHRRSTCSMIAQGRATDHNKYISSMPPYCGDHSTETAAVRCCSDSASNPFPSGNWYSFNCNGASMWAASEKFAANANVGCQRDKTYQEAYGLCTSFPGGRLCTLAELESGCTTSGCNLNKEYIWSSTMGGTNSPSPSPTTSSPTRSHAPTDSPHPTPPPSMPPTSQLLSVSGELKRYHKITVDLAGPSTSEGASPNPFLSYRFEVTFTNLATNDQTTVPGYFAADGNAAETSATSGNVWRAHFVPPSIGSWRATTSFVSGTNVAVNGGGTTVSAYHGLTITFDIIETDKSGRDFSGKGILRYVGERYPRFDSGEYFVKAGADSPENFLAYYEFDGTYDNGGNNVPGYPDKLHHYDPHELDWNQQSPKWQGNKGKRIIGAVNYLASTGANTLSFLTYNKGGDTNDVWPFVAHNTPLQYDVSKLAQWEIVFEHADKLGMHLTFKMQETENDNEQQHALDGGNTGTERKLYYRELIARFGHHRALQWMLGEETSLTTSQNKAMAAEVARLDPYGHNIALHTYPQQQSQVYTPLLGSASELTGASVQSIIGDIHNDVKNWVTSSASNNKPWIVYNDEQGPWQEGIKPDTQFAPLGNGDHQDVIHRVLWATFLAGGAGVEAYFGYNFPNSDMNLENWRSRDAWWKFNKHILDFFSTITYWTMESSDNLVGSNAYCFAEVGKTYVVYHASEVNSNTRINLSGAQSNDVFKVEWFDPFNGGNMQQGSMASVQGGGSQHYGVPPSSASSKHWVVKLSLESNRPTFAPITSLPTKMPTTASPTLSFAPSSAPVPSTLTPTVSPATSDPTRPPSTSSPTPPTPACFFVAAGSSRKAGQKPTTCVDPTQQHYVRCCASQNPYPSGGWSNGWCPAVYAASSHFASGSEHSGCRQPMSHAAATAYCVSVNGRLCTKSELEGDCTKGTGCSLGKEWIWSSSTSQPTPPPSTNSPTTSSPSPSPTTNSPTVPQPSLSPVTSEPTGSPVTSSPTSGTTCNMVAPGAQKHFGSKPAMCADPNSLYKFRCCKSGTSNDNPYPAGDWTYFPQCSVWASSRDMAAGSQHDGCRPKLNFADASAYCSSIGTRLCTVEENFNDCTKGTGCNLGRQYMWTSTVQ